jgi:hypothetical protein
VRFLPTRPMRRVESVFLTTAEMVGGELVTVRRFKRPLLMVGAASGGALARGSTPKVAVGAGDSPFR